MQNRQPSSEIANILLGYEDSSKYAHIIERAKNNGYHDFKFDNLPEFPQYGECICPKAQLFADLIQFPELSSLAERVMEGEFDDKPDDHDCDVIKEWLKEDEAPEEFYNILGLLADKK